jgi:UDP-glucose 6-dehydrogenase
MTNLKAAVRTIARVAMTDKIIVEKSTVPCGTASTIRDLVCASHLPVVLRTFALADVSILTFVLCVAENRS